mmetsp:Transcript_55855/g.167403  ORF Transcript_55855/g.167403 Transcript_55855/m.167403 type:complete len:81 (+) Transcript_55855:107-349(+)
MSSSFTLCVEAIIVRLLGLVDMCLAKKGQTKRLLLILFKIDMHRQIQTFELEVGEQRSALSDLSQFLQQEASSLCISAEV